ncbi:MAG: site-specific DNA-methyltransferase, partial [Candidatus Methanosuratincola sp.]
MGVPVEGESGFINLMRLKTRYFQKTMRPTLQAYIDEQLREFPDFREELFDKLYTFFKRYISEETGSIGFFFTPYHQSIYEQVYTDTQDVILFWKTQRLYYVKTDRLFRSMETEVDGFKFFFDASTLEHKKANEKRELVFQFKEIRPADGAFVFTMHYSERGRQTSLDTIRRAIRGALGLTRFTDAVPSEETLERAFRVFERQSEVDYFLCKDAKSFLREQFDLWMWQYLLGKPGEEPQTEWTEARLKQLQALKRIAYRIIDYIAAFEDELVKIWNKPKFVLNSNYVITLDRIVAQEGGWKVLEEILKDSHLEQQVQEWRELGMVGDDFTPAQIIECEKRLNQRYQYLPIDTRYFKDLELRILGLFDHLDDALDGWLIKSENYQALNTILPKWQGKVQCIYIDPPYNTTNDEFVYKDAYRHSSWCTLMENRLQIARDLLSPIGMVFVSVDDNEQANLRKLMDFVFGSDNFVASVAWWKRHGRNNNAKMCSDVKDFIMWFRCSESLSEIREPRTQSSDEGYANPDNDPRGLWTSISYVNPATKEERPNLVYGIVNPHTGEEVWHPTNAWKYSYEEHLRHVQEGRLYWGAKGEYRYPRLKIFLSEVGNLVPTDVWTQEEAGSTDEGSRALENLFGFRMFTNPKPPKLVEKIGTLMPNNVPTTDFIFLDFFAGSGTTAHAVMNLNRRDGGRRRFILVEMADYFYSVLLPRVKKVAFSDKWREGKAQPDGKGVSQFVKCYELEQFEDALRRTRYTDEPLEFEDAPRYLFLRDPKMTEAMQVEGET